MRDARSPFDFVFGLEFFVPGTTICTCHFRRSLVALPEIRESPYPSYKAPRAWDFPRPRNWKPTHISTSRQWSMSGETRQKQQRNSIGTLSEIESSEPNISDSTSDRNSSRRAQAGALLVQVYERGPKGGISPTKVLFEWTKELVSFRIPRSERRSKIFLTFFVTTILIR